MLRWRARCLRSRLPVSASSLRRPGPTLRSTTTTFRTRAGRLRSGGRGDVDFAEADLTGANLTHTDFQESRFFKTNLTQADFSHAVRYSIAVHLNTVKKAKFSLPEAMSLLYALDILLVDDA